MTKFPDLFTALAAPFEAWEVRERKADNQSGRMLAYVTSQAVKNRLDQVLGPENWASEYAERSGGIECRLTITLPDGSKLTKADAGAGKDLKAAYSDALKRAAEEFGVGRYLRQMGVPEFARGAFGEEAPAPQQDRAAEPAYRSRPAQEPERRPALATYGNGHQNDHAPRHEQGEQRKYDDRPPTTGRALFARTKELEQKHEIGLLKYINSWAKLQDWPSRMIDWDGPQVGLAYTEICRKLQSVGNSSPDERGDAYEESIAN